MPASSILGYDLVSRAINLDPNLPLSGHSLPGALFWLRTSPNWR